MATRRMFSKSIVQTDAFMDMPASSQLLYFHLVMEADDEGFVSSPKKIMRTVGSSDDDLRILIAKKFIIPFENSVCVIKHWLIHNTIRLDRYNPTSYQEEKKQLTIKENKSYTLVFPIVNKHISLPPTFRQPSANLPPTELKLTKLKLTKEIAPPKVDAPYTMKEEIQKLYDSPRRDLNIIGLYFEYRNPDLKNREQYGIALKRHLKPAKPLTSFNDNQLINAFDKAKKEYADVWTLETIMKILTK